MRPENENQQLPMQHYLENGFNEEDISPDDLRQDKIAEVSRLAVPREFRRKHVKSEYKKTRRSTRSLKNEIQCYPYVAIGLYFTAMSVLLKTILIMLLLWLNLVWQRVSDLSAFRLSKSALKQTILGVEHPFTSE